MDIESYLKSELARDAVGKLTSLYPDQTRMNTLADFRGQWGMQTAGAWRVVGIWGDICEPALVSVYYRPDGERFIVSDLGEGVKSLRLRLGRIDVLGLTATMDDIPQVVCWAMQDAFVSDVLECDEALTSGQRMPQSLIADLPDAICRVMLASYKVSHLTDERGMG